MSFKKDLTKTYTHFMNHTIKNKIFNIFLTIIENIPILIAIDFMWMDDFLSKIFTPLYYLSPHVYLDKFNQNYFNECSVIINSGSGETSDTNTINMAANSTLPINNNGSNRSEVLFAKISDYFYNLIFTKNTNKNIKIAARFLQTLLNNTSSIISNITKNPTFYSVI